MRIDCYVPITLRIVGVPTDDQLAAAGAALTRAVAARLAEAERVLAQRYGPDRRAAGVREQYDPDREGAAGYAVPSYGDDGRPTSVPVHPGAAAAPPEAGPAPDSSTPAPDSSAPAPARPATTRNRSAASPARPATSTPAGSPPTRPAPGSPRRPGPRGRLDVVHSAQQLDIDLHPEPWDPASGLPEPTPWREVRIQPGQTQIVYILTDARTGEALKVGKTTVDRFVSRFGEYVAAGNKWGRALRVTMFTMRKRANKNVEQFEQEIRAGMERAGHRLPWDNTRRRLGKAGKGIPEPTSFAEELSFIDEAEAPVPREPTPPPREAATSEPSRAEAVPAAPRSETAPPAAAGPVRSRSVPSPPRPFGGTGVTGAAARAGVVVGGAIAAANDVLAYFNLELGGARHAIAEGEAQVRFWEWAGARPTRGVWRQWSRERLPDDTPIETSTFGSLIWPYIVDIDVQALRRNLPDAVRNYQDFLYFLSTGIELDLIEEVPRLPNRPGAAQRAGHEHARYFATVSPDDPANRKIYEITDIVASVRAATLAALDDELRIRTATLSPDQRGRVFRLRGGADTPVYRSANRGEHGQPIVSAQKLFGPDPWVRVVGPVTQPQIAGRMGGPTGVSSSDRVRVTPANADAERSALVSVYAIFQTIDDTYDEVVRAHRPILSREPAEGRVIDSFVAGPAPGDPRFGNTRYYRHPEFGVTWTGAIGQLNEFYVEPDQLVPLTPEEISRYVNSGAIW